MDPITNKYLPNDLKPLVAKIEMELKDPVSVTVDTNIGTYIMEWRGLDNFSVNFNDNKTGRAIQTTVDANDLGSSLYEDIFEIINKKVSKYIKRKFNEVQKLISEKRLEATKNEQFTNSQPDNTQLDNNINSLNPNTLDTNILNTNQDQNNILNNYMNSGNINNNSFYNNTDNKGIKFGNNILKFINKKSY